MPTEIHTFLADHRTALVQELTGWLRLRSVGGIPELVPELNRSAHWLAAVLREVGFPGVEIWQAEGAPAVYAEWCAAPGAPTVLIYSHHDVRVSKDEQWEETSPFEPALRDGYLYGRGASDAKGQVIAHLWGIRAHLAATGRDAPAVNLKVLVEGEEETGSAHLAGLLDEHRPEADLIVFSDTLLWRRDHPAVCTSMRGTILAELEIYGPERDVHSGAVSGPAPNPAMELARLIAALHDDKGRITLPGFYDAVAEPSERTRAEYAALPYSDEDWLARSDTRSIGGEEGYTVLERLWARPAIEVLTIVAGDPEGPSRAAIPAVASASLSIRTVPDQTCAEVAEQLRRWVKETVSDRVEYQLSVSPESGQDAYRTPDDLPAVAHLAAAMQEGFGAPVGRMGNAGGGPADLLTRVVGAPAVFFGTGLPEDRWHDSDERASIDVLTAGAATLALFWARLADG
ncbi:M20/M25/M40 family metallo-hydrolase [Couchioplanes caeruleus]|uniref:M20/M25/M40 family metallo-hydrolase n=1 Tax=Couchioplanes caeruleus TaxID=56438 RepID=UPI00201C7FDB|nr:M20/M25/M40 family metallo-hydrolase [Couchioplanes caeruleus]UQU61919.1 M20/M25/M40 family metallo-hydrolase [Couchioplanes caeruleus]